MIYCCIISFHFTILSQTFLGSEVGAAGNNREEENIKYVVLLKRRFTPICSGSLVSPRHIMSAAGCISLLLRNPKNEPLFSRANALIGNIEHKIIKAVTHHSYKPDLGGSYRTHDVGLALVCLIRRSLDKSYDSALFFRLLIIYTAKIYTLLHTGKQIIKSLFSLSLWEIGTGLASNCDYVVFSGHTLSFHVFFYFGIKPKSQGTRLRL